MSDVRVHAWRHGVEQTEDCATIADALAFAASVEEHGSAYVEKITDVETGATLYAKADPLAELLPVRA